MTGPGKSPSWNGARITSYWLGGTPPRKTSDSVPRLTPETQGAHEHLARARVRQVTWRISPDPGSLSQKARDVCVTSAPSTSGSVAEPTPSRPRMTGNRTYGGNVRVVHAGPLAVLPCASAVLAALAVTVGLGRSALVAGAVVAIVTWALVEAGMRRKALARLGLANAVTLVRATLVVGVAALVVQSWHHGVPRSVVVGLTVVALTLDFVDGRLARARGTVSAFGAAFDMETDAFLILVLSVYVVPVARAWVLLIGLARYLLLGAGVCWPWLPDRSRRAPGRRWWRPSRASSSRWQPRRCCRPGGRGSPSRSRSRCSPSRSPVRWSPCGGSVTSSP